MCRTIVILSLVILAVITALSLAANAAEELEVFAGQDKTGRVNVPVEFNDARIINPDPLDPERTYTFSWDFDDRKDSNLDGIRDNDGDSNEQFTEWTYHIPSTYTVTLTVFDGFNTSKDTLEVTIKENAPPNIIANDTETATVGEVHVFNADANDDYHQLHLLRWHWDFGDGTTSEEVPPVAHTYNEAGNLTVKIRVTDPDNAYSEHIITLRVATLYVALTLNVVEGETLKGVFAFCGTVTGNVVIDRVEVRFDGGDWQKADGVYDWTFTMDTTTLGHGNHTIDVRGGDGDAWYGMASVDFDVDNPPSVVIWLPVEGERCNGTVLTSGSARDDHLVDAVEVRLDEGTWTLATGTTEWELALATGDLNHGNHTIHVRAYDGVQYSATVSLTFFVDQVPSLGHDEPSGWSATSEGITATGNVSDDDMTGMRVDMRIDGGPWEEAGIDTNDVTLEGTWTFWINITPLAYGTHELEARAYDGHHFSEVVSVEFLVDRPPEVSIDPLPEDREVVTRLRLSGDASDDGGLERIEYRIDGGEWVNVTVTEGWEVKVPVKDLEPGLHTVEVRAFDGAAYSDVASMTFKKERERDSPGFGTVLASLAMLCVLSVFYRRLR